MSKRFAVILFVLLLCAGAAHAQSYDDLAAGPWGRRAWCGYDFAFVAHPFGWPFGPAGMRHRPQLARCAEEAKRHGLLTPVWEDPAFKQPLMIFEWDWGAHMFLENHPDIAAAVARSDRTVVAAWFKTYHEMRREQVLRHRHNGERRVDAVVSMPGHYTLANNAAEWGAAIVGQEILENIIATQLKLASLRGAARQHGLPWFVDVSQWHNGTIPLYLKGHDPSTPVSGDVMPASRVMEYPAAHWTGGHSISLMRRMWYVCWLSGVNLLCPEGAQTMFFACDPERRDDYLLPGMAVTADPNEPVTLSPFGLAVQRFLRLTRDHSDRGITLTPVAVMLDPREGFIARIGNFGDTPTTWGVLPPPMVAPSDLLVLGRGISRQPLSR